MRFLPLVFFALIAQGASASEITLGRPGVDHVFVWKDNDAHREAVDLISSGVHKTHPDLVFRLMSCTVPPGTHAIVTDGGMFSSTILVTDGQHAGCRGFIPNEDIRQ